jgi:hypothetical protein
MGKITTSLWFINSPIFREENYYFRLLILIKNIFQKINFLGVFLIVENCNSNGNERTKYYPAVESYFSPGGASLQVLLQRLIIVIVSTRQHWAGTEPRPYRSERLPPYHLSHKKSELS